MLSNNIYGQCAEVLTLAQSAKDDLAAVLSPETGFAPRVRQLCRDQLADLEQNPSDRISPGDLELLRLESDTWALLQVLMAERKTERPALPTARSLLAQNPYTSPATLAQAIMARSRLLSELVVVREWLHDTAPAPRAPDATTSYRVFTRHRLAQARRQGLNAPPEGLVRGLDPDAPNKEESRALAGEDANHEKMLVQALYSYVRAGRLEDALELCNRAQQPWRAATIRGSILFRWDAIEETGNHDSTDAADANSWSGNRRRTLWKDMCTRAALNTNLSHPERVLYAALAPSPQTSAVLRSACRTWADHVWAQISVLCEARESSALRQLGAAFWDEEGDVEQLYNEDNGDDEKDEDELQQWEQEAEGLLAALDTVSVEDGPPADNAFHVSQLHIILGRTDALLEGFATGLTSGAYDLGSPDYPGMTRFFAHLCLFLQLIDISVPPMATQTILEAYLQVLESAGQRDLIAQYAGALGANAVERYALFLTSLALSADADARRAALVQAREHGLDVQAVAVSAAERTIEKAFDELPVLKGSLPEIKISPPAPAPSDPQLLLLRSIEWTTFHEATYDTALEQANVILRYFLASGEFYLARSALALLPRELSQLPTPEERANEYMHYRQLFVLWDALERVRECAALDAPGMNRETRAAWLADYRGLIDQARELAVKLLTSEWLIADVGVPGGDRRRRELIRIRQIYIPELILRVHEALVRSRHRIPENLRHALELANVVADARYRLYDDFGAPGGHRLGTYVGAVRAAVLLGLQDRGGSDPFRVVKAAV